MLKTAQFVNSNNREKLGVAYSIFDDNLCVFTALDDACMGSSINNAEAIIKAICDQERIDAFCMRFFDLQTRTSYGGGLGRPQPGDFEFDEVIIVPSSLRVQGFHADCWNLTKCPSQVITKFAAFIDGTPRQDMSRAVEAKFYESSI